ncbi:MAG: hypothetical protein CVU60_17240 [Deltaproteobacteria bacterium HGW-Deltaproteobacteria-18]|jgi:hypothetical protein|nr:MAG: hypothetical protein CVU60_17240 [Deltaproteobacteria bacterium HGW-Deltaproteobacteria-18]
MEIPSIMIVGHEPVTLDFETLESACKLNFNEDQRARLTSAAEAYRAWNNATRSRNKGGLLCTDKELKLHFKKITKMAKKLAALLNVNFGTHPREFLAVDQLWDALGLEKPNIDPRYGLSRYALPYPETKRYRPQPLAACLEMYALGAKAFAKRIPEGKAGHPEDWNLVHYIKVLRVIFREAGGGDGILCYKSEALGGYQGAFFHLACEWRSQALGLPWQDSANPIWLAVQKEQEEKREEEKRQKEIEQEACQK